MEALSKDISVPLVVVLCDEENIKRVGCVEAQLGSSIPGVKLITLADVGNLATLEALDEVA